jgi:hypothetical protein
VEATGNYNPLSPPVAIALFFTYLFYKNIAPKLAFVISGFICVSLCFILVISILSGHTNEKTLALFFLMLLQVLTILILLDKEVKTYLHYVR